MYPEHENGDIKYNGSILECLLRHTGSEQHVTPFEAQLPATSASVNVTQVLCTKLLENSRMNASLARFTQFTYGADYVSQTPLQSLSIIHAAAVPDAIPGSSHTPAQQAILRSSITNAASMCVINVQAGGAAAAMTRDDMATTEARIVRDLYTVYAALSRHETLESFTQSIIIVTPNHVQRRAVRRILNSMPITRNILVETCEKCQGKTAELVIMCYTILTVEQLESCCDFLFTPSRLNVSLSRARAKVIVIVGDALVDVPAKFIRNQKAQHGYKLFLHALQHSKNEQVNEQGGYQNLIL